MTACEGPAQKLNSGILLHHTQLVVTTAQKEQLLVHMLSNIIKPQHSPILGQLPLVRYVIYADQQWIGPYDTLYLWVN